MGVQLITGKFWCDSSTFVLSFFKSPKTYKKSPLDLKQKNDGNGNTNYMSDVDFKRLVYLSILQNENLFSFEWVLSYIDS